MPQQLIKAFIRLITFFLFVCIALPSTAQTNLINNIHARKTTSLNGKWQYIVDPYETGFYDYRYQEKREKDPDAYWNTDVPKNKTDRKEHGYSNKYSLNVPGDWNHQETKFLYYEGSVWYKRSFDFIKTSPTDHVFIYFGAVNYRADVYLNGKKLGMHKGGFTPFNFEIPDSVLQQKNNFLVVKVDNKRFKDEVPTVNTDWWNYGGITRDVQLVEVSEKFIRDYFIQLKRYSQSNDHEIEGWVKLNNIQRENVEIDIPELKIKKIFAVIDSIVNININVNNAQLWSPDNPKLYQIKIITSSETVVDKIGFRTIEAAGKQVLLNGKPIFMRGICMHEEIPMDIRRAYSKQDAIQLLSWAKSLNCNMVRLAHYPHDETMTQVADSLGILVWSEIPVYWTIDFTSKEVFEKAQKQLTEMITRDHNRASVIIWSVGNETPVNEARTTFMHNLISAARELDATRLISAALQSEYNAEQKTNMIDDPLGKYVDLVSFNEYLGWYGGLPSNATNATWKTIYEKPLFISETGAEALGGFHADSLTRWSEEYQEWYYREQVAMLKHMPENFVGVSPWILVDFRSPRRNNPVYQEGWNNKGLLDHNGKPKKAFYILKNYYKERAK